MRHKKKMTDTDNADSLNLCEASQQVKPSEDLKASYQLLNTIRRIYGDEDGSDACTCPLQHCICAGWESRVSVDS